MSKFLNADVTCVLLIFAVIFLGILFVLFGLMSWLVLYPGPLACKHLQMYNFTDMGFKMLLVAVAALNLLICFVVEVSDHGQLFVFVYLHE